MNFSSKCILGCLLAGAAGLASASTVNKSGAFTSDTDMFQYTWTLPGSANVILSTDSYAQGGFVPVVSLFDSTGAFIAGDGGSASCSGGRMMDASTGLCNDSYFSASLAKGSYTVVLTEFDNFPNGPNLSDGFFEAGMGNFTSSSCVGASGPFFETDLAPCAQRTGSYSLNIAATATPEPATAWLALPALAFACYRVRRTKSR